MIGKAKVHLVVNVEYSLDKGIDPKEAISDFLLSSVWAEVDESVRVDDESWGINEIVLEDNESDGEP